jgi:uncharacterized Tic20 family protein
MPAQSYQKPKKTSPPPREDHSLAAVSHLSILTALIIGPFCMAIPLIIWLMENNKTGGSKKLIFEAKQAFFYQLAVFLITAVFGIVVGILSIILVGLLLIPVLAILPLAGIVYGVYGGIKVWHGELFRYKYIADLIETEGKK